MMLLCKEGVISGMSDFKGTETVSMDFTLAGKWLTVYNGVVIKSVTLWLLFMIFPSFMSNLNNITNIPPVI